MIEKNITLEVEGDYLAYTASRIQWRSSCQTRVRVVQWAGLLTSDVYVDDVIHQPTRSAG